MASGQILQPLATPKVVLVSDKIYMVAAFIDDIVVFDFTASSLSRIPLPQEVKYDYYSTTLSRADDASEPGTTCEEQGYQEVFGWSATRAW